MKFFKLSPLPKEREFFTRLFQILEKLKKPFTIELLVAHLGQEKKIILAVPTNIPPKITQKIKTLGFIHTSDQTVVNPAGVHAFYHLRLKKALSVADELQVFFPEATAIGEGYSLVYQFLPERGRDLLVTISVLGSANKYSRASDFCDQLAAPFVKTFKAIKSNNPGVALADYSFRRFNYRDSFLATASQAANIIPVAAIPKAPPSDPLLQELQMIIGGELLTDDVSLDHYATDGSVFQVKPWAVVLPKDKMDLLKLVRWVANKKQSHSEYANKLSLTCRGKATDQAGGPLNEGLIIRFPNYLDKILEIGPNFIRVEPGILWSTVNDELAKVGRFIPCYPASAKFASIGGGVANNCSGEKTIKYGSMRDYLRAVKMIIADGQEVEFSQLDQPALEQKQALKTLEGEIYRSLGDLVISNHNLIENSRLNVNKNSSGYWLNDMLGENTLDLTKLICGGQGTLGILTEITLKTIPKPTATGLLVAAFDNLEKAGSVISDLLQLRPSALEMVDKFLIEMVQKEKPEMIEGLVDADVPVIVLLIEFDNSHAEEIKQKIKLAKIKLAKVAVGLREAYDPQEQEQLWQLRRSAAIVAESAQGNKKALPFIEDVTIHPSHFVSYLNDLYSIMKKYDVKFSVWGHAGNGNIHIQPFLDLGDPKDREKLLVIAREVYQKVIALRGSISGEHNDGLMRTPFLKEEFGEPMHNLFVTVKKIFDSQNIFNPGKKIGADMEYLKKHLRAEYEIYIGSEST